MNTENLLRVADAIEKHEIDWLGFNMVDYIDESPESNGDLSGHDCGTTACIAGWAAAISGVNIKRAERFAIIEAAQDYLGLAGDVPKHVSLPLTEDGVRLFIGRPSGVECLDAVTPDQAVRTLRYAAKHGKIDWDAAQLEQVPA